MTPHLTLLLTLLALTACGDKTLDQDGDGYDETVDCDDLDASVHPDADEYCNLVDDDCNGAVDDEPVDTVTRYADTDGDTFGDPEAASQVCPYPATPGLVDDATDCDDSDPQVHPGATEDCTDPRDLDCDGDPLYADVDEDGWAECEDCDDSTASTHPGADETCNEVDDDCDGYVDEDATDATEWHMDLDGDGYGSMTWTEWACDQPAGFVEDGNDCDDTEASVNPGATEICDGLDNDCDSDLDEEDESLVDASTWYADTDGDHFGDASSSVDACDQPEGYVADDTDCDDTVSSNHPGSVEVCDDAADNDCDGYIDEDDAIDALDWYLDDDGDGWGLASSSLTQCAAPSGYVSLPGDCDDADATAHPYASELCDTTDHDCDGDDTTGAVDMVDYYEDADGDGWGAGTSAVFCPGEEDSGWVDESGDCDDADDTEHPWATEWCDGEDEDCDGTVDNDAVDADVWYADSDGDGYGDADAPELSCDEPSGYVDNDEDCDDTDADVSPNGEEVADNGADDDCDGHGYWLEDLTLSSTTADAMITETSSKKIGEIIYTPDVDGDGDEDVVAIINNGSSPCYAVLDAPTGSNDISTTSITITGCLSGFAVGDDDGDGSMDLLIGDHVSSNAAFLLSGPITSSTSSSSYSTHFMAESSGDYAGTQTLLTDVDSDGYSDSIVSAVTHGTGGAVYVFMGPVATGAVSLGSYDAKISGGTGDLAGLRMIDGDITGDGVDDVVISANSDTLYIWDSTPSGALNLTDATTTIEDASSASCCLAPRPARDVDGDGTNDLLVSSGTTTEATAFVFLGPVSGALDTDDAWASFSDASCTNGFHIDSGDLDGDDYADLALGCQHTTEGSVWIQYGAITSGSYDLADADALLTGTSGSRAGALGIGDFDGDGQDDLAIGASTWSGDNGAVFLFYGTDL